MTSRPPVIVATIVSRNHVHYARAFARSVRAVNPELTVVACIVDGGHDDECGDEPFRAIAGARLGISDWGRFRFQYPADELCYAVKPFLMEWLLANTDCSGLMYFDADIIVYRPLTALMRTVLANEIVLTPQLASPAACRESELISRQYGVYNAGFVGVRNSAAAPDFLRWWQGWTRRHGVIDFGGSLACDQGWLDLVPGLFGGVHVERGAHYNAARWNLAERDLRRTADRTVTAAGEPLVFFHFSGFHPDRARDGSAVFWPGLDIHRFPLVKELCVDYADRLDACGRREIGRRPYAFASLTDGTPIDLLWREAVRIDHPELAGIDDPLDATLPGLRERFARCEADARVSRHDWRAKLNEEEVLRLRTPRAAHGVS